MKNMKLPDRSFKVKFKIFRFGFTDFDVFVRRFTQAASWKTLEQRESAHTYAFENGWNITLHPHGDISLYSPLLKPEQAKEVYGVIDVLIAMDVRVGENCEVETHYESKTAKYKGLINVLLAAAALVLFLATKTAQILNARILRLQVLLFFESAAFIFAVAFAYFLFKSLSRDKRSFEAVLLQASQQKAHEDFMRNEDIRRKLNPFSFHAMDLVKELNFPVENILAYIRFYKSHTQPNTQHWNDLMEIMEQTTHIRELMNRVEARLIAEGEDRPAQFDPDKKIFRKSARQVDLIPLVVRGTDLLGEAFESHCHTLNISETGACLLLPHGMVVLGQEVELQNEAFKSAARVRWVIEGKAEKMMLAGLEFAPAESSTLASSVKDSAGTPEQSPSNPKRPPVSGTRPG